MSGWANAPEISNNIVAFNSSVGIYCSQPATSLYNNDVYNHGQLNYYGISAGTGDISSDPLFADAVNGDYHLTYPSPCIDAGDDYAVGEGWVDMDGEDRQLDVLTLGESGVYVDMGADEFWDATAPSTPSVTDDGAYTTSSTQLHATWTSSDSESAIAEYEYAIGTTQGGTNVVNWTPTGTTASVTHTGLSLTSGQAYYFSVKAKNACGYWSSAGNSDGIRSYNLDINISTTYVPANRNLIGFYQYPVGEEFWEWDSNTETSDLHSNQTVHFTGYRSILWRCA